jgi:hypothetical protein
MHDVWQPLLAPAEAESALDAVDAIVTALANPTERTRECAHDVALLHAYWADARGEEIGWRRASLFLGQAAEWIAGEQVRPGLIGGFAGVAWVFEHLCEQGDVDGNRDVDATIVRLLGRRSWSAELDLISGLVGFGVYGLARLDAPSGSDIVRAVVSHLEALAQHDRRGASWYTPAAHLLGPARREFPHGRYDLGMAHGAAGIVALLARIKVAGIEVARTSSLLDEAVRWLLSHELAGKASRFASFHTTSGADVPARAAWCYGDPGIALAVWSAANALRRTTWLEAARRIAGAAAQRRAPDAGVVDAALCHGAAGLGHVFHRLYRTSRDEAHRQAALHWFRECLGSRRPGVGIAGFQTFAPAEDGTPQWIDQPSLVGGAAGIGLALIAAATALTPRWDELMLMGVVVNGE